MVKNKLKEIRMREYMMSQTEFIELIGIDKSTYNSIELNKVQGNAETILKICIALKRRVEDIWYLQD